MQKPPAQEPAGVATPHKKPYPEFPLHPHKNGCWAKKVRGKRHYFGAISDDPKGVRALNLWLDQQDALKAGRVPRARDDSILTLLDICNAFLTFKKSLRTNGELAPRTYKRYYDTCQFLLGHFGRDRRADDIEPGEFVELRAAMAKRWGKVALGNEIQTIRSVFKFAKSAGLTPEMNFGPAFVKPSATVLRVEKIAAGPRMFTTEQFHKLLKVASVNMRAMLLLGINGGLGNTDLGELPIAALDLKAGWLTYPRPKTGVQRRVPLWEETVKAIQAALKVRPEPKCQADERLLFIGARGRSYCGEHKGYRVAQEFDDAARKAKVSGRTFYDLRRTFETIGENSNDAVAVSSIMGHAPRAGDMASVYRQRIDDARLLAVVRVIHDWLFAHANGNGAKQSGTPEREHKR